MNQKQQIEKVLENFVDVYKDFYITKNNLRLFIPENLEILYDDLKKGDKVFTLKNTVMFIVGYADNSRRKYLKIATTNIQEVPRLLFDVITDLDTDLFIKLKRDNPLIAVLQEFSFSFFGGRGTEILLKHCRG